MKKPFYETIKELIRQSDIVLEVLDARFVQQSRNLRVETLIRKKRRKLIYVLNKCDLVKDKSRLSELKQGLEPCILISSTKHFGIKFLKNLLIEESKQIKRKKPKVGIIGYPNVGKSSVINAMLGRVSAKTSPEPGFTKGLQWINIEDKFLLIDSPGVIPFEDDNVVNRLKMGSQKFFSSEKHLVAFFDLMEQHQPEIARYYGVKPSKDVELTLEKIALKRKMLLKGNEPDTERAMRTILMDLRNGKIFLKNKKGF